MSSENIKFQEMLKEVTKDILSEDSLVHIQEAFDSAVQERVDLHVETALVEQDDSYANKLTKLLEAVDIDHCSKLERLVEAINNEAVNLKESLVDNISNYLELYVDKAIPKEQLTEAVSNKRSKSVLQELRQVLAVDSMLAKDTVKSAIQDGKRQIVESTTKVSKLHTENKNLKETLNRAQAELILERKSLGLPERKKQYVMRVLQDKSAQFITENFDYTVKLFEKEDDNIRTQLKEQATTTRAVKKQNVDVIVEQVKPVTNQPSRKESASNLDDDHDDSSSFDTYMGELGKY